MSVPLRKILRTFYPDRFSAGKQKNKTARSRWKRYTGLLILVFAIGHALLLLFYYNTFVSLLYDVQEAQAQVDTHLQRRKNIILNLGIMVMDYAKHEREIFTHAAETRKEMLEPGPLPSGTSGPDPSKEGLADEEAETLNALLRDFGQVEEDRPSATPGDLEALLSKIFAIAERYPDLRLSENFESYMDALVDAEDKIAEQRMIYNERANEMSTAVSKFPGFIFAKIYRFEAPPFFESEPGARTPPEVEY